MKTTLSYLSTQYDLVCQSRAVLFDYCKTLSEQDFIEENSSFGRGGSVRNLLVHIANTYEFWIGQHALKKDIKFTPYDSCSDIHSTTEVYKTVDRLMIEFIDHFSQRPGDDIHYEINDSKKRVDPFKLFTHVITHEFHHKGQILSLSRHLGYTPVDTDIMR